MRIDDLQSHRAIAHVQWKKPITGAHDLCNHLHKVPKQAKPMDAFRSQGSGCAGQWVVSGEEPLAPWWFPVIGADADYKRNSFGANLSSSIPIPHVPSCRFNIPQKERRGEERGEERGERRGSEKYKGECRELWVRLRGIWSWLSTPQPQNLGENLSAWLCLSLHFMQNGNQ